MDGPLGGFVDLLAKAAEHTTLLGAGIGLIAAIQLGSALAQFATLARSLRQTAIAAAIVRGLTNPYLLIGGLAAAALGGAAISSMLDKSEPADDLASGYGDRTLVTPNGSYALNNNDTVIAGTNLFKGNDVFSGPKDSISLGQPEFDYGKLAQAMSQIKVVSVSKPSEFAPFISREQNKAIGVKI
jgi:hypothetical protein